MEFSGRFQFRFSAILTIAFLAGLTAPRATAAPLCANSIALADGATVSMGAAGSCTGTSAGTLLASLVAPYTTSSGLDTGTITSAVYREAGGTLDFYYQIVVNTTSTNCGIGIQPTCDSINRLTAINFNNGGAWTTWASSRTDAVGPFSAASKLPQSADRNSIGDTVGFTFSPPDSAKLGPGQTSAIVVVSTNATNFVAGLAFVQDGGVATVAAFEPAAGVPEPASFALLGLGLLSLGSVRRLAALSRRPKS